MPAKKPDSIDALVGNRVKWRRLHLGMSQERLGAAIGVSFQQVQKYESASNRISSSRLQQIANILKVPVPYFFDTLRMESSASMPERVSSADIERFLVADDGRSLARALTRIKNTRLRKSICELVKQLAE
jgi:transcriptional regulator with XRE-family HTH domain